MLGQELFCRDLGPAVITWDPDGVPQDLYPTKGSHVFKSDTAGQLRHIMEDGHGEAPVDSVPMGRIVTVTSEFTRLAMLQLLTVIAGSTGDVDTLLAGNLAGCAVYDLAKPIIIKPLCDGDTISADVDEWLHVFKAYPFENIELNYNIDDQRIVAVTFQAYPSNVSGLTNKLYRFGDA